MDKFYIKGGLKLDGETEVYSAKNAVLALLAASILTDEQVVIHKCPKINDVFSMIKILQSLGCVAEWQEDSIVINSSQADKHEIPQKYGQEIRSSIFMLGSILARFKKAKAVFPGGCDIGLRPIDLHIKGLKELNVEVKEQGANVFCNGENARGKKIHLDFPSVGATENIMLASTMIKGKTTICNAAKEPEIVC
ncbi:MAG: UDP-N-acetylglucosamine 1-carboxyvinyltransferase, partial [Clostridia bacterium]|nr:UDP-N-acetylglucosamine 1-carboxyvinyltransferase [Clostridia bacterium]